MSNATGKDTSSDLAARLEAARELIERRFRHNPKLDEIACAAHLSSHHFHRLFRRHFGKTPKQMVTELQVREVQRLALKGARLNHAAKEAGFAHGSHMTSRFKSLVGMTPRAWVRARPRWGSGLNMRVLAHAEKIARGSRM